MFGLNEQEMNEYKEYTQSFAIRDLSPRVIEEAKIIAPTTYDDNENIQVDRVFVQQLITDIETIVTITTFQIAYDYAYMQTREEIAEEELIEAIYRTYEGVLMNQFIKYSITFTSDVIASILGEIILELPFIYSSAIQDDNFDEDLFLEERLEAYNTYLEKNFLNIEDEEDEE